MAAATGRGTAAGTPRRGKDVRGLRRADDAGDEPKTGEVRQAQVFVAVLGASNYTYAEATWTQNLWDWIHSHVRAFEFFDGTSQLVIPDNLKSGVKKPCYYEPELNRTYGDLAAHYGVGILPARPYRPRDKAKAEVGVQIVQRWVLAALRKRQFFSLAELNEAILGLVHKLNERPFRKLAGSRAELYQSIDRPALQPLPLQPFVYAEWKKARVNLDYHIELGGHYYSTPYQLVGKEVEGRSTQGTVEIFHQGKRVASHVRSSQPHVAGPMRRTVRSLTSNIWSGRRRASSHGRARLAPSRRGWWRAS